MSACIASSEIASSLFLNACSISEASLMASAEGPVCGVLIFGATVRVAASFILATTAGLRPGLAAGALAAADLVATDLAALGDDIDLVPFFDDLILLQLHLPVRDALAGLHVVFHA